MEQFNDVINRLGYTSDDDEVEGMLKDVSDDTNTSTTSDDHKNVLPHHSSSSWLYRLKYALQHHLRGLILTVLVCTTASACGFYAFQSYAADVISLLTSRSLQYVQVHYLPYVGLMKLLGTIVALVLIDGRRNNNKVGGRRRLLLTSILGIALAEGVLAALLQVVDSSDDINIPESIPVILFYLVIFFWSIGLGPILLMAANEYMPTYTRGVANSVALTFTSVFEILYQQTFELMLYESPTPSLPFYIYSITCIVVFIVLLRLLPETKGLSLEDSSTTIGKAAAREGHHVVYDREIPLELRVLSMTRKTTGEGNPPPPPVDVGTLEAIRCKVMILGENEGSFKHCRVELTSENDIFFHYTHSLDEMQFSNTTNNTNDISDDVGVVGDIQEEQKLMIEFNEYVNVFIKMCNSCIAGNTTTTTDAAAITIIPAEPHAFLGVLVMARDGTARLGLCTEYGVTTTLGGEVDDSTYNRYKFIELLSAEFIASPDTVIRQHITYRSSAIPKVYPTLWWIIGITR
ncbi:hypothetical protein FOZ60_012427 [Perkinsus olseni]|uniref:Major facilitator superfamily (MFS) profile domain-containing protein n=1 Tax=Perkinsus olseni TaxID=32597 RepID=A0A7J6NBH7_PEROL|nr:hypothetical protein FOZ60_012427 [Perkinsus olseni]